MPTTGSNADIIALRGEPGYVWRSGQERRLRMIREWVDLAGLILDNGCGLGTYLEAFAPYSRSRYGLELEFDRAIQALDRSDGIVQATSECLPFVSDSFDFVLSNEVIEHVVDDFQALAEMVRITRVGGRIIVFCPNRWYPVEQHGIFWRGKYKFGNIPLVNYLPNSLRNRLAPHVRVYSGAALRRLYEDLPVDVILHRRIFGGYDNIEFRWPRFGRMLKKALYSAESTPASLLGISHLLVLEKRSPGNGG